MVLTDHREKFGIEMHIDPLDGGRRFEKSDKTGSSL